MELNKKYEIINRELELENEILKENMQRYIKENEYIDKLENENLKLRKELEGIIYSRSYKTIQKIKKVLRR